MIKTAVLAFIVFTLSLFFANEAVVHGQTVSPTTSVSPTTTTVTPSTTGSSVPGAPATGHGE